MKFHSSQTELVEVTLKNYFKIQTNENIFCLYLKIADDSFYTGITNNLERRLYEHNAGIDREAYTFKRRPVELVWFEIFTDPTQAIIIEKQLKGWSRRKKQALIVEDWDKLVSFSKNYTQYGKDDESSTSSD